MITLNEFVPYSATFTYNKVKSVEHDAPGFIVVSNSDTSVTISYDAAECFLRTINYLDSEDVMHTTNAFESIPEGFHAVIQFIAPTVIKVPFTVTITDDTAHPDIPEELEVDVKHFEMVYDWGISNSMLKTKVAEGLY